MDKLELSYVSSSCDDMTPEEEFQEREEKFRFMGALLPVPISPQ